MTEKIAEKMEWTEIREEAWKSFKATCFTAICTWDSDLVSQLLALGVQILFIIIILDAAENSDET